MKLSSGEKTGITTVGATGITILAGVIFAGLSPWWLILSVSCILSAVGHEHGLVKK
jgi:hypothetical protein|tara:strand:+ start:694 stop:861 length:168 start_codon:yes stop_codon:yes gene_type:complete